MYYSYEDIIKITEILNLNSDINKENNYLTNETKQQIDMIKKKIGIENKLKKTIIQKQNDYYATICILLNKLSDKNYDKLKIEIFDIILNIKNPTEIDNVTRKIFTIASSNMFYSSLFSKLYKELIDKNNNFYYVFEDNFILYSKTLRDIEFVSSNVDYDKYCNYIKKITELKAGLLFFTNLMKYNICNIENIITLCNELIVIYKYEIPKNNEEYKTEILESIFIIIKETYDYLIFNHSWENIYNDILFIKNNEYTSKKIKFKCLDIIDFIHSKK